jgi:RimJ/RimL family protein N-acetyltransferase
MRPVTAADTDALRRCFDDPGVRRYLFDDARVTLDATRMLVDRSLASFAECGLGLWVLVDGAALVGFVALQGGADPRTPLGVDRQSADLLYGLLPSYWGIGLATRVARRVVDYGVRARRLTRITANVDVPNRASIALLERLEFAYLETKVLPNGPTQFHALETHAWPGAPDDLDIEFGLGMAAIPNAAPDADTARALIESLAADGYRKVEDSDPPYELGPHWHPFDVVEIVTAGDLTLVETHSGRTFECSPGTRLVIPRRVAHSEHSRGGMAVIIGVRGTDFAAPINRPIDDW